MSAIDVYSKSKMTKVLENHVNEYSDEEYEPNFSDPEDYVDRVKDEEFLGDLLKLKPKETDGIDCVIVVDNVPQVGPDRLDKLKNIIRKIYSEFGEIVSENYPFEDGKTKGFIFLQFKTPHEALEAVKATDGHKLDKKHTFFVKLFSDFDKYMNISDNWEEPTPQPYKDHGNMYSWLLNTLCYDQFTIMFDEGNTTALYLNTPIEPTLIECRARWTEKHLKWSPNGTYLLTYHHKGIALWGGEKMSQIMKFSHQGVQLSDFSPCERYLVTFSPPLDTKDDSESIIFWELSTGKKKRSFHCDNAGIWPVFKWSFDGAFFARVSIDTLSIYETPSFGLQEKKSLKIKNLKDFSWSPTDPILSYWTGEEKDTPARVILIELPSRNSLCFKNLFTVADCKMHWQKSGQYLCVKVDRYKNKKEEKGEGIKYVGIFHNFNVFRIKEKEIPVDTVEVKDPISAFAWEPVGHRFAIIHGETPRIGVSFYYVKPGGVVELVKTFEKKSVNHLFWNPNGQFIVLAGLRNLNGVLEFIDTSDMSVMAQAEHFMATDVEWDPTGRYIATGVSWWGHKVDNAFWIWNFQGKLLCRQTFDKFCQLMWRPRPPPLLTQDQLKELKKNMKPYNSKFNIEDKKRESKASKEQIDKRQEQLRAYEEWRSKCHVRYVEERKRRHDMRQGIDTDKLDSHVENFIEEVVEFLVKVDEIILEDE